MSGGIFDTFNKAIPGVYQNFKSKGINSFYYKAINNNQNDNDNSNQPPEKPNDSNIIITSQNGFISLAVKETFDENVHIYFSIGNIQLNEAFNTKLLNTDSFGFTEQLIPIQAGYDFNVDLSEINEDANTYLN